MDNKVLTVAILGVGSRGADSYGKLLIKDPRFKITSLCDIRECKITRFQKDFDVDERECFLDENEFFKEKRADILIIATQDRDHVRQCIKALHLGYDVLLEKPITPVKQECYDLLKAQKETGRIVLVCHVLRYAKAYTKVKTLLDEGTIGKLIDIHALEQVAYWHQAHSFVRGNWRSEKETSPMILAKTCHDMDLLQWYAGSKCESVSSVGDLSFFKKENQPKDATDRCQNCKYLHSCPYSAYRLYVDMWKAWGSLENTWPFNVVCNDKVLTEEGIIKSYESNQYGRCVFACDNDVVDHQETNMLFQNGVTANLCMTAFTGVGGRIYQFHGTMGEIDLDEESSHILIKKYGFPTEEIKFNALLDVTSGHGGGDVQLIQTLYDMVLGKAKAETSLEASIESHLMSIAAEESRKNGGICVKIEH